MSSQRGDYDLAFNEVHRVVSEHGPGKEVDAVLEEIQRHLTGRYPDDEEAIHELMTSWLVTLRIQTNLEGFG